MNRVPVIGMNEMTVTFADAIDVISLSQDRNAYIVSVILRSGDDITMGIAEDEKRAKSYFNYVVGCITSKEVN